MEAEGKRWGDAGVDCGWRRMRGEGQSFGISRARWVQACARVLDPRGILSVLPQTRQAGHVSSFGLWAGGGDTGPHAVQCTVPLCSPRVTRSTLSSHVLDGFLCESRN